MNYQESVISSRNGNLRSSVGLPTQGLCKDPVLRDYGAGWLPSRPPPTNSRLAPLFRWCASSRPHPVEPLGETCPPSLNHDRWRWRRERERFSSGCWRRSRRRDVAFRYPASFRCAASAAATAARRHSRRRWRDPTLANRLEESRSSGRRQRLWRNRVKTGYQRGRPRCTGRRCHRMSLRTPPEP